MFEQDFIMRQIRQIIQVLMKVLFNIDDKSPSSALIQDMKTKETADDLFKKIEHGNINEAENVLFKLIENKTMDNLLAGIVFYSYLNEKDDDYLESNNFSHYEVEKGIKYLLSEYGLENMSNIFFFD